MKAYLCTNLNTAIVYILNSNGEGSIALSKKETLFSRCNEEDLLRAKAIPYTLTSVDTLRVLEDLSKLIERNSVDYKGRTTNYVGHKYPYKDICSLKEIQYQLNREYTQ